MANTEIDVEEICDVLAGIRIRASNPDRAVLATLLLGAIDDVIESEGAAGAAGAWEPFSPNTRRKRGEMAAAKLLQDNGLLASMQIALEGHEFIEARSQADYAIRHVEGNENLPVRDPFEVDQELLLQEVEQILMDDIERAVTG